MSSKHNTMTDKVVDDANHEQANYQKERGRGRIPQSLWAMAIQLAEHMGSVARHRARPRLLQLAETGRGGAPAHRRRAVRRSSSCPHRSSSPSSAGSSWITAPGPPCACNWLATTRPMSRPSRAASGTPGDAQDHAPDEDPGGRRAGRFSPRIDGLLGSARRPSSTTRSPAPYSSSAIARRRR